MDLRAATEQCKRGRDKVITVEIESGQTRGVLFEAAQGGALDIAIDGVEAQEAVLSRPGMQDITLPVEDGILHIPEGETAQESYVQVKVGGGIFGFRVTTPKREEMQVRSVNGKTGTVALSAADIATLADGTIEEALAKRVRKAELLEMTYPVGSIYLSINAADPRTLFGGEWERMAQGRMLAGIDEADEDFSTAQMEGGEKTHKLLIAEMPSHSHEQQITGATMNGASGDTGVNTIKSSDVIWTATGRVASNAVNTYTSGGGQAHNNMPPYLAVYMWKRTA